MRDIRRKLGVLVDDDDDDDDDDRKPQMMDIHRYSGSGVDTSYTQNRELSWLRFNERVLDEAMDSNVPLFERMKFIEIFTSNLDEFFMVRVGSLFDLKRIQPDKLENKGGMTPGQQLAAIFAEMPRLYKKRDDIYQKLQKQLETQGIVHLHVDDMGLEERQYFEQYFREQLLPVLSPQVIDLHHPFPHLENKELLVGALLKHERHVTLGMVPLAPSLPRFLLAPGNRMGYVLQEELIQAYLDKIFMNYPIIDRSVFTVTRDADINPDDEEVEYGEDYVKQMKNVLKKRRLLPPVRLEVQTQGDSLVAPWLSKRLGIPMEQCIVTRTPLTLGYVYGLEDHFSGQQRGELCYPPYDSVTGLERFGDTPMMDVIRKRDVLLAYPYEDFGIFLQVLREAVNSKDVVSIRITIYRVGKGHVKLMNYLILAAELGKEVTVLLELKARFDEQNNMDWVDSLRDAGVHILYGFEGYKVHAKVCLITEHRDNKVSYLTYVGTGNFNAKTAHLYTDYALMTADQSIGRDAAMFFRNMGISNLNGNYEKLLVAPSSLKQKLLVLINEEIGKAERGEPCGIRLKVNSITDRELIDALQKAGAAGVRIDMVVRGICCLVPGLPGLTENIHIHSIVGRFLEHGRIYAFGQGAQTKLYIASADWMTRNTENRVEVACPIERQELKDQILEMFDIQFHDTKKGRRIGQDGCYHHIRPDNGSNSQEEFMKRAKARVQKGAPE
ncbi:polyphosphate kinase 1 [Selenomonas sp.]|uniref:polyphosphate kinase 1 n=1 Tax=Selenomonas sp. TaxID=2053611 RepID=UPI0025CE2503|nr:polyphosphate kinase 1 [Selenomonas sp.]MCI6084715.1 polyphosphate kinase 1 [Selenomonas sp.]MDY3298266.1 polyphosphate kinase 1 [Selenomonas sp.]MDY4415492.1 polyphosphate kinase 1 [Selenomonas sp.]